MAPSRTIYFLANDAILEHAIAFLNSLRAYNPITPLCLIPFDDNCERLHSLRDEYHFGVWTDQGALRRCDDISLQFHGVVTGHYRKLAMWNGPSDEFIYVDTDTVVLQNLDVVWPFLRSVDFLTSHSHLPALRQWVWKESIGDTGVLSDEQIHYSASMGFIASKRGMLSLEDCEERLPNALALAQHMVLECKEQPFLNYLMVTSGRPYDSLSSIADRSERIDIPRERWVGDDIGEVRGGRVVLPKFPPVLLVHWAGEWRDGRFPYADLWSFYRNLRCA